MMSRDAEVSDSALSTDDILFNKPDLNEVLSALAESESQDKQTVSPTLVYGLSDLSPTEWQRVAMAWRPLSPPTKRRIMRALHEASEALFEVSYREMALHNLGDESAGVRENAIELLWTDESEQSMRQLIRLADHDPEPAVRIRAVKALGRFILLGEFGDVSEDLAQSAQQLALRIHTDATEPLELRRRALEALADSSHPRVKELISSAYADGNLDLKISAIFAMGRTCNSVWRNILLEELESNDNEVVYEAATACGHIQLEDSVSRLGELALHDDREIQLTAIWALGEIGGPRAVEILTNLEDIVEDEETVAVVNEALDIAGFQRSLSALGLNFDED